MSNSPQELVVFLFSVFVISLSGALMPGPVFALALAKGQRNKFSGLFLSLGHGLIEIPLMVLLYAGMSRIFGLNIVQKIISISGGVMLIVMGINMFINRSQDYRLLKDSPYGSMFAGLLSTAANPYFLIWWSTIGAALVLNTRRFGIKGFILFAFTHWCCDAICYLTVSWAAFKSRRLWSLKVQSGIIGTCSVLLLFFGFWFILGAIRKF
ncbi:MAG: LysE family transporter [Candidatus Omnitrophota bacterium]